MDGCRGKRPGSSFGISMTNDTRIKELDDFEIMLRECFPGVDTLKEEFVIFHWDKDIMTEKLSIRIKRMRKESFTSLKRNGF